MVRKFDAQVRPDVPGARTSSTMLGLADSYLADGDPAAMRRRHGRLAAGLLLIAVLYALVIITVVGGPNLGPQIAVMLIGLALVPIVPVLPWGRMPNWATVVPAVAGVLVLALIGALTGQLLYSSCLYGVVFTYSGLTQRAGITGRVGVVALIGLAAASVFGQQSADVLPIAFTIIVSTCVGEVIALSAAWHRHARSEITLLHDSLTRLVGAESEHEAAEIVADVAAHMLRADGAITLLSVRRGSTVFVGRGGAGGGANFSAAHGDVATAVSGTARCVAEGVPVFVPDARADPGLRRDLVDRFDVRSVVYIPLPGEDGCIGSMTVWWTKPQRRLEEFDQQVVELLTNQAGQVIERLREVASLDVAATTDPLTGVGNRRAFDDDLAALPVGGTLIVLDLDHFKGANDQHGHSAGDNVLRDFGALLTSCVRETDTVTRLGGDEFALFLPTHDSEQAANAVLQRLREQWPTPLGVTFSAGLAKRRRGEVSDETLARADTALYDDKHRPVATV
jgi:diguanylate cyclase (GGDEF)-like protein